MKRQKLISNSPNCRIRQLHAYFVLQIIAIMRPV